MWDGHVWGPVCVGRATRQSRGAKLRPNFCAQKADYLYAVSLNVAYAYRSPRVNPPIPILRNRCLPSLVMVPVGVLRDQRAKGKVFLDRLECRGISRAISNRDPSRIWPLASLSPSRRTSEPNR